MTVLGTASAGVPMSVGARVAQHGDAVVLAADTTLNDNANGTITFNSTVDADLAANHRTLTVNTGGDEVFDGLVGNAQALAALTTDTFNLGGQTQFNMDASTAAAGHAGVNVFGPVTVGDAVFFNVANSTLSPDHASIKTSGGQTYSEAATPGPEHDPGRPGGHGHHL